MIFYLGFFLLLLNVLHVGLRRLNDKMRLPLTKKVSTVAGDSLMQFFLEMIVVVLGEAYLRLKYIAISGNIVKLIQVKSLVAIMYVFPSTL